MQPDIDKEQLLEVVFEHYEIPFPQSSRKICCPVHDETHPSCLVSPDKGLFFCHACGVSGDGYNLIELKEGVDFVEAKRIAEEILERSGADIRGSDAGNSRRGVSRGSRNQRTSKRYKPSWSSH